MSNHYDDFFGVSVEPSQTAKEISEKAFEESKHRRSDDGKFSGSGSNVQTEHDVRGADKPKSSSKHGRNVDSHFSGTPNNPYRPKNSRGQLDIEPRFNQRDAYGPKDVKIRSKTPKSVDTPETRNSKRSSVMRQQAVRGTVTPSVYTQSKPAASKKRTESTKVQSHRSPSAHDHDVSKFRKRQKRNVTPGSNPKSDRPLPGDPGRKQYLDDPYNDD